MVPSQQVAKIAVRVSRKPHVLNHDNGVEIHDCLLSIFAVWLRELENVLNMDISRYGCAKYEME